MSLYRDGLRHVRRLRNQYPLRRRLSTSLIVLTLIWITLLYWGERSTFASHIAACRWDNWERWPSHARPHHLVFVADPQLVDPHTYPGRPWPLSSLTESYTDRYMGRNFRLINLDLDPDTIVFLGDLFDGGREWATSTHAYTWVPPEPEHEKEEEVSTDQKPAKRSLGNVQTAVLHDTPLGKRDESEDNLKVFVPGENGRWNAWGDKQWRTELKRFGQIFFQNDQLYPDTHRELYKFEDVAGEATAIKNGAKDTMRTEYALRGGKQRRMITSLPGNHDLGFGERVQLPVRNRFVGRFGEANQINVIGNHTILSLDSPSLSAVSQWVSDGETTSERAEQLRHIWEPTMQFLDNITNPAEYAVKAALDDIYHSDELHDSWKHEVLPPQQNSRLNSYQRTNTDEPFQLPVILLTHVPLYRESDTDCGNQREQGRSIRIGAGYQYQNVVTRPLSNSIMSKASQAGNIVHVFSGDDHDYCEATHLYNFRSRGSVRSSSPTTVPEITVKSFSWAMGVRKPGFLLVSLWNPVDAKGQTMEEILTTVQTKLCLLPDQLGLFINYALFAVLTMVLLLVRAVRKAINWSENSNEDGIYSPLAMRLPRIETRHSGSANGYSTLSKYSSDIKGRQRGSSTSMSKSNSTSNLGVQRSYNARTRSISPAPLVGYALPEWKTATNGLIDKAGYYPELRWNDPNDSDEESHIGSELDSQEKVRRKGKRRGRARIGLDEFAFGLASVGIPTIMWYAFLLRRG